MIQTNRKQVALSPPLLEVTECSLEPVAHGRCSWICLLFSFQLDIWVCPVCPLWWADKGARADSFLGPPWAVCGVPLVSWSGEGRLMGQVWDMSQGCRGPMWPPPLTCDTST
jgi:hypothetical protein